MTANNVEQQLAERVRRLEVLLYDTTRTRRTNQPNMRDLKDANLRKVANGQIPSYNSLTGRWDPVTPAAGTTLLNLRGAATTTDMLSMGVTADTFNRFILDADGSISIGTGAAAAVVALRCGPSNTVLGRGGSPVGSGSTAVGASALQVGGGGSNTAVGLSALQNADANSVQNVAVGASSLASVGLNCSNNVAIGYRALTASSVANGSVAVGSSALAAATTGNPNTAVGESALSLLTTGGANTVVGKSAGSAVTTGDNNVALGRDTLTLTTSGSRQVSVGSNTGQTTATQRNDSVAVGYAAKFDADNACALGSGAQALHAGSTALGQGTTTTFADQVMIGARDLEITATAKGVVIKSPDGTRYRIQVANGGALSTVAA